MTGRDDARHAELLDDFWIRLRIDATTPIPAELDPATAELVQALEHDLRPSDPDSAFLARLRSRLMPTPTRSSGAIDVVPATTAVAPRAVEHKAGVVETGRSRTREVFQMVAAVAGIAVVGTLLVLLFRDTAPADTPEDQPIQPAGEPATATSQPVTPPSAESIYQIVYSAYADDGTGKRLILADLRNNTSTPLTAGAEQIYAGMASWSPDGRYIAYNGSNAENGILVLDVIDGESFVLAGTSGGIMPRWSPNGSSIAYIGPTPDGNTDIYLVDPFAEDSETPPRRLTETSAIETLPVWSPDGSQIAFAASDGSNFSVYVIDRDGGDLREISDLPGHAFNPTWSPDGTRLAFNSHPDENADIYVSDLATGTITNITDSPEDELNPVWSPDGATMAFTLMTGSGEDRVVHLWLMDADGSNRRKLIPDDAYGTIFASWSPDGERIAATLLPFERRRTVEWRLVTVKRDGTDQRVLTDRAAELDTPIWRPGANAEVVTAQARLNPTPTVSVEPTPGPTVANDRSGDLLAPLDIGAGQIRLWVVPANGSSIYQLIPEGAIEGNQIAGVWSPDGSQIAITTQVDSSREIYIVNVDGTNLRQLAPIELAEPPPPNWVISQESPAWSPDGASIAFSSNRAVDQGGQDLYVVNADGTDLRRLTDDALWEFSPRWSPDGTQIAFEAIGGGRGDYGSIYITNTDGSDRRQLVEMTGARDPNWSPDGEWIAFAAGRFGSRLNIVRPDGSDGRGMSVNALNGRWPRWSPDGSFLAWSAYDDGGSFDGIAVYDMSTGDTRLIHGIAGVIEWSPDGQWMAVAMPEFDLTGVPTGKGGLYLVAPNGSNQFRLLAVPIDEFDIMLDWRVAN